MATRRTGVFRVAAIVVAILLVIVVGSAVYWFADGSVGTPREFQTRVADTGLDVDWSNVGPRAGDGTVATDCGQVRVTVNDLDGELWLTVGDNRQRLSDSVVDDLTSCQP